jgi:two-component system cell cycle sensor histidine kinase/response regulator CckA
MEQLLSVSAPAKSPASPPWILVVDDELSMLRLMEAVLQARGWDAVAVDSGEKALTALKVAKHPPAVVVCDILMPLIDGLELTRRMLVRAPDLKVIHISGHLTDLSWWPTDLREHRFLAKPFDNLALVTAVEAALADRGSAA